MLQKKQFSLEYKILKQIGQGSTSKVYEVNKNNQNQNYAMKVIDWKQANQNEFCGKLIQEIVLLKTLNHSGIIKLYDVFKDESKVYIVNELGKKGNFHNLLAYIWKTKTLRENFKNIMKYYLAQLVSIVSYLNNQGILHRDIKIENIIVKQDLSIKLIDFGSAQIIDSNFIQKINPQKYNQIEKLLGSYPLENTMLAGSKHYISPQMIKNNSRQSKNDSILMTDVWSLGILMYYLFLRKYPFQSCNAWKLQTAILNQKLIIPQQIDKDTKTLIQKMLEKQSKNRISLKDIMSSKFFEGVDFSDIFNQQSPILSLSNIKPSLGQSIFDKIMMFSTDKKKFRKRRVIISKKYNGQKQGNAVILVCRSNNWIIKQSIILDKSINIFIIQNIISVKRNVQKLNQTHSQSFQFPSSIIDKNDKNSLVLKNGILSQIDDQLKDSFIAYYFKSEDKQLFLQFHTVCGKALQDYQI